MFDDSKLKRALDWEATPSLTQEDIEDVIEDAALTDANGVRPYELGWIETVDFKRAVYLGWQRKLTKAVAMIDFDSDDASFKRSQYIEHCKLMMTQYAPTSAYTIRVRRPETEVQRCYPPLN